MGHRDNPDGGGPASPPCGIFVVDKPVGCSSMAAVATVRRCAGGVRTGHAGTLDPLASGVLVLALGRATKHVGELMNTTKRYLTEVDLSAFSSTDDLEGELQPVPVAAPPSRQQVASALTHLVGTIAQQPPAFSAIKIDGRRAYKMARAGQAVDIPPRTVQVHALELRSYEWPLAVLEVSCGKGVYVRSLARDLGSRLQIGGYCRAIRRTAVGPFTLDMACPLQQAPRPLTQGHLIELPQALALIGCDREATERPSE